MWRIQYYASTEGDDDFMSIYGCTKDWENPTDANSLIPGDIYYTAETLKLEDLPDPSQEDCEEDESVDKDALPFTDDLGGEDVTGNWCSCDDNECNGATSASAIALMITASALAAFLLY